MLARGFRLTRFTDFNSIFEKGLVQRSPFFSLRFLENNLFVSRFGIVISTKIDKRAVYRNYLKRQIREIIRLNLNKIKKGFDIVLIVNKKEILKLNYNELQKEILKFLEKANLLSC